MEKPPRRRHRASTEPPPGRKHAHAVKKLSDRHIATFALLDPYLGFKYLTTEWIRYFVGGAYIYNSQVLGWLQEKPNCFIARPPQQKASPNFLAKQAIYELAERGFSELVERGMAVPQSGRASGRLYPNAAHRSNSYPHELIVDIGFYAPLRHAVDHAPHVRLISFAQLLKHREVPEATRRAEDPLLITLQKASQKSFNVVTRFDGTPFVLVITSPNGQDENRCVPGLQVDRGTRSLATLEQHVDHAIQFVRAKHYVRHFGFDTCLIPFLFTEGSRQRHVMGYVEKKYGPCKFLLFKLIPDFHQDLDHFPKPGHYDPDYSYAVDEWRPPDTIHVITSPWSRVGYPDFQLIGENP
jgi:hypothetical protein